MPAYSSREALDEVLARLAAIVVKDPVFAKASKGKNFTVGMDIYDLGSWFETGLADGQVTAGIARPADPSTIQLKMKSEVFDGVFSGRVNPMSASMRGDLTFSGSMSTALKFQSLLPDFIRCYKQARAA